MIKRKFVIPCLRTIAEAAKKYAADDPILAVAFEDLAIAEQQSNEAHESALKSRGLDCVECGKRFLPLPDDYSGCCSLGCKFR